MQRAPAFGQIVGPSALRCAALPLSFAAVSAPHSISCKMNKKAAISVTPPRMLQSRSAWGLAPHSGPENEKSMPHLLQVRGASGSMTAKEKEEEEETPAPPPPNQLATLAPGVAASAAVMTAGFYGAEHIGSAMLALQGVAGGASPISGIPVAVSLVHYIEEEQL